MPLKLGNGLISLLSRPFQFPDQHRASAHEAGHEHWSSNAKFGEVEGGSIVSPGTDRMIITLHLLSLSVVSLDVAPD